MKLQDRGRIAVNGLGALAGVFAFLLLLVRNQFLIDGSKAKAFCLVLISLRGPQQTLGGDLRLHDVSVESPNAIQRGISNYTLTRVSWSSSTRSNAGRTSVKPPRGFGRWEHKADWTGSSKPQAASGWSRTASAIRKSLELTDAAFERRHPRDLDSTRIRPAFSSRGHPVPCVATAFGWPPDPNASHRWLQAR